MYHQFVVVVGQIYAITGGSSTKIQGKQNKLFASARFPHPVPDFLFWCPIAPSPKLSGRKVKNAIRLSECKFLKQPTF